MTKNHISKLKQMWKNVVDFFKYNICAPIRTFFHCLWWFFHNLRVFWKILCNFRDYDFQYVVDLFITGLVELQTRIENGNEERLSASKKVQAIRKLISELRRNLFYETSRMQDAGTIGMKDWSKTYNQLSKERYERIFAIIAGQDPEEFDKQYQETIQRWKDEHNGTEPDHEQCYIIRTELFDGSGIEGWWE